MNEENININPVPVGVPNLGQNPMTVTYLSQPSQKSSDDVDEADNLWYFKKHCKLLAATALFGVFFMQLYINKFQKKDLTNAQR